MNARLPVEASSANDAEYRKGSAGGLLHVEFAGNPDKAPLILLNSLGTNLHMWDAQVRSLSADFNVMRMDTRGHGRSRVPDSEVNLETLGQDVLAAMNANGIVKAHLCGISMGGLTALWLGLNHPQRFHCVIAANTAARIGSAEAWLSRAQLVRTGGAEAMRELAQTAPQRWFTKSFCKSEPDTVEELCKQLSDTDALGYARCCEALAHADIVETLSEFSIPLCIVAGESDPVTTPADARFIQQRVKGAVLESLRASHLSNVEQPAAFNRLLLDFCSRVPVTS